MAVCWFGAQAELDKWRTEMRDSRQPGFLNAAECQRRHDRLVQMSANHVYTADEIATMVARRNRSAISSGKQNLAQVSVFEVFRRTGTLRVLPGVWGRFEPVNGSGRRWALTRSRSLAAACAWRARWFDSCPLVETPLLCSALLAHLNTTFARASGVNECFVHSSVLCFVWQAKLRLGSDLDVARQDLAFAAAKLARLAARLDAGEDVDEAHAAAVGAASGCEAKVAQLEADLASVIEHQAKL